MQADTNAKRSPFLVAPALPALALCAVVVLILLWKTGEIWVPQDFEGGLSARLWPRMTLLGMLAGIVIKSAEIVFYNRGVRGNTSNENEQSHSLLHVIAVVAVLVIVVFLMEVAGFVISSFLLFVVFLPLAGMKSIIKSLIVAVGATVGMLYVFTMLVYVPLPKGTGCSRIGQFFYIGCFKSINRRRCS